MNPQTVGNVGLYYTCYRLSLLEWNVMPTSRNAKGIDILAYSQDGVRRPTIQVKSLSKRYPVPLGGKLGHLFADWVVICCYVDREPPESPECFVLTSKEVRQLAERSGTRVGKDAYWLPPKLYESAKFREAWKRIGSGSFRAYWEGKASAESLRATDELLKLVNQVEPGAAPKYNRLYIGLEVGGAPKNFVTFIPLRAHVVMTIKLPRGQEVDSQLEEGGLDLLAYDGQFRQYKVRLKGPVDAKQREVLLRLMKQASQALGKP